jgi:hypothetical protein
MEKSLPPVDHAPDRSRRVYVVAGMHRAGTSVVARALQALGVDLGAHLMSADVRMNARGFFEDLDLVRIDDALLAACNADWKNVALLDDVDWTADAFAGCATDAQALLAARLTANGTYGCKDPRIPRLLPFWQRHFAAAGVHDHYVIAIRHPLSVIASLTTRDQLDLRRSAWLWLIHLVCAMRYTAGRSRVVVDYDRMLAAPDTELDRMRIALSLAPAPDATAANASFTRDFLSQGLRHAEHGPADLANGNLPPAVIEAWTLASAMAGDHAGAAEAQARFDALFAGLRQISPLLGYAGTVERAADDVPRLEGELAWAKATLAESAAYAESLRDTLAKRDDVHTSAEAYAMDLQATVQRKDAELVAMHRVLEQVRQSAVGRMLLRAISKKT